MQSISKSERGDGARRWRGSDEKVWYQVRNPEGKMVDGCGEEQKRQEQRGGDPEEIRVWEQEEAEGVWMSLMKMQGTKTERRRKRRQKLRGRSLCCYQGVETG